MLRPARLPLMAVAVLLPLAGCNSPYHADRGALVGGLLGAGTGAIVGNAVGSTGAGAAIGAGVGALSGAAIGSGMDEVEARNRAMIAAQMGREVRPGAVTAQDVVMMSQGGVEPALIVNHIRANGMAAPPTAQDLIALKQQGVDSQVVMAMQQSLPPRPPEAVVVREPYPPPVIVEEHIYGPPPYYYGHHHCAPGPRVGVGFSFHD